MNACNDCKICNDTCWHPSIEDVDFLKRDINSFIVKKTKEFTSYLKGLCGKPDLDLIDKLNVYDSLLDRIKKSIQNKNNGCNYCVCPSSFYKIESKIRKLVGKCMSDCCETMCVDKTNRDSWLVNNPGMIRFDRWEKAIIGIMPKIEFEIKPIHKQSCELIIEVERIYKENCELDLDVIASKNECSLVYDVSKIENQSCELTFEVFREERKCPSWLTGEVYKKGIECKLNWDFVIKSANHCDLTFEVNKEMNCLDMKLNNDVVHLDNDCIDVYSILKNN